MQGLEMNLVKRLVTGKLHGRHNTLTVLVFGLMLYGVIPARAQETPQPEPGTGEAEQVEADTVGVGEEEVEVVQESDEGGGEPAAQAEEVVITGTKTRRLVKETPVKTEVVTRKDIERTGAINLVEALAHKTGVRVDNQCSICNATAIKLSGLPGRYTLMLIDGIPIFSSLGQTYGLMNIEAAQIERVEIVKGANSVLYGTDAIGGVVNIITRKPGKRNFATLSSQYGSYNSYRLSGAASVSREDLATLITMSHSSHDSIDRNNNGVSEYTGYARSVGSGTFRWNATPNTDVLLRVAGAHESRQGGGDGAFMEILDDDDGRRGMSESILTERAEVGLKIDQEFTRKLGGNLMTAYTYHNQDSDYEGEVYNARQHIVLAQAELMGKPTENLHLVGGVPYRVEYLDENLAQSDYQHHMIGAFVQADWHIVPALEAIGGFRYDYHNQYGNVYTPRIALKWAPKQWVALRGGFGTGFRTPTTFYEYAHGVRPDGYKLKNNADKPETSMSANLSATFDAGRWLNATVEGAWNRVKDPIGVDLTDDGNIEAHNVDGTLQVLSAELAVRSRPLKWLQVNAGYGYYKYWDEGGALASAPPSHQINASLDFDVRKIGFKATIGADIYAPMDLEAVYGAGYNIKSGEDTLEGWLDEANADLNNPKMTESPWYFLMNVRLQQRIAKGLYLYAGINNIFDYHQADEEGPLYFPADDDGSATPADVVHIWGPMRGRYIYGGLKADF